MDVKEWYPLIAAVMFMLSPTRHHYIHHLSLYRHPVCEVERVLGLMALAFTFVQIVHSDFDGSVWMSHSIQFQPLSTLVLPMRGEIWSVCVPVHDQTPIQVAEYCPLIAIIRMSGCFWHEQAAKQGEEKCSVKTRVEFLSEVNCWCGQVVTNGRREHWRCLVSFFTTETAQNNMINTAHTGSVRSFRITLLLLLKKQMSKNKFVNQITTFLPPRQMLSSPYNVHLLMMLFAELLLWSSPWIHL